MSLQLYYAPGACSFVPHALLEIAGVPFEAKVVKLHKGEQSTPEYLAMNPRGQVPVLVDNGTVITQILAIVGYINDKYAGGRFLPADPLAKAKVMERLAVFNNTVHPTFTHVFMPGKFTDDKSAQGAVRAYNAARYREHLERLRDGHGFTGSIAIVKDYVAGVQQRSCSRSREMFVPLIHLGTRRLTGNRTGGASGSSIGLTLTA